MVLSPGCIAPLTISPAGPRDHLLTGVFLDDKHPQEHYRAYVEETGIRPQLLLVFVPWPRTGANRFPAASCRFALERHATPIITWEPWEPWSGWSASLDDIAAGSYDRPIRHWAEAAGRWRHTVLLRFAHEMNGDWYPWCERKDPRQTAKGYTAAWQRIHRLFKEAGADNVQFVWSPNFEPTANLDRFYPGDGFVDWIGVSVYNRPPWRRLPEQMLQPMCDFALQHGRPIILAEVGCDENDTEATSPSPPLQGAAKAAWIGDLFTFVAQRPAIHGLVWFDVKKEADWRIASSPASADAYRRGLWRLDPSSTTKR